MQRGGKERSWTVQDVNAERLAVASLFIEDKLKPAVRNLGDVSRVKVVELMASFRLELIKQDVSHGVDFKIDHVWVMALHNLSEDVVASKENMETDEDLLLDLEVFRALEQFREDIDRSSVGLIQDIDK